MLYAWARGATHCIGCGGVVLRAASPTRFRGSEPAFGDEDGVAGAEREGGRHLAAVELALDRAADFDLLALGARREAARNGDGGLRRHVGDVGILAGRRDLAG